jgi:retron-type reverse transcriptase
VVNRFPRSTWIIEGDIKGCFDNIRHDILLNFVQKRVSDQRVVRLISLFLKAGYMERREYHRTYSGTPQGGIISPLLCNVYLNALDSFMEDTLGANREITKADANRRRNPEYRKFNYPLLRLQRQYAEIKSEGIGLTKRNKLRDAELRNILQEIRTLKRERENVPSLLTQRRIGYVRYADDYLITLQEYSKADAEKLKADLARFLKWKLRLDQDEEKTLISHPTERIRFLGYNFKSTGGRTKRPRLDIPKEAVHKVLEDVERQCKLHFIPDVDLIKKVNSIVIGWMNYYRYANGAGRLFNRIMAKVFETVARFLTTKYKSRRKQIFIKFKAREVSKDGRSRNTLGVKVGDRVIKLKTIPPQTNNIYNVYPKQNSSNDDIRPNIIQEWAMGRSTQRALEALDKANRKCEQCGTTNNLNVHHISGLRGKKTVQSIVAASEARQTIVLCRSCHLEAHGGARYRNANRARVIPA